MSALGFGLFVGSLAAIVPTRQGFSKQLSGFEEPIPWALTCIGIFAWLVTPALFGGIADFVLGLALPPISICLLRWRQIREYQADRLRESEEAARQLSEENEQRARAKEAMALWMQGYAEQGWQFVSKAKMMNAPGAPSCIVMISNNALLLQICEYALDVAFTPSEPVVININQVLGLNVARPKVTKHRNKTIPVSIVESREKSPVTRGLIGGALLGPAGLVLGAASGLNSKTSTTIQDRTVKEAYESEGDPQLIVGTALPERPVFKIKFDPPSLADEWLFRIRGAQQRRL